MAALGHHRRRRLGGTGNGIRKIPAFSSLYDEKCNLKRPPDETET